MRELCEQICSYLQDSLHGCSYSTAEEIGPVQRLRFFYDGDKSFMLDYDKNLNNITGLEVNDGDYTAVTFERPCNLPEILPFVKDFLLGKIRQTDGVYISEKEKDAKM